MFGRFPRLLSASVAFQRIVFPFPLSDSHIPAFFSHSFAFAFASALAFSSIAFSGEHCFGVKRAFCRSRDHFFVWCFVRVYFVSGPRSVFLSFSHLFYYRQAILHWDFPLKTTRRCSCTISSVSVSKLIALHCISDLSAFFFKKFSLAYLFFVLCRLIFCYGVLCWCCTVICYTVLSHYATYDARDERRNDITNGQTNHGTRNFF